MTAVRHSLFARTQTGAVLVTSLLMLLVLTIIGVTAMQMSRMQERMAGNTRDMNVAFQGAEAAVRAGEATVAALTTAPVPCSTSPCDYWLEGSIGKDGRVELATPAWWDTNGKLSAALPGVKTAPAYVVEELGYVPTDGIAYGDTPVGRMFYQVSGRSTGGTGLAETVVQSTFTRRF